MILKNQKGAPICAGIWHVYIAELQNACMVQKNVYINSNIIYKIYRNSFLDSTSLIAK